MVENMVSSRSIVVAAVLCILTVQRSCAVDRQKPYYTASVVEMYPRGSYMLSPQLNIEKSLVAIEEYVARASNIDKSDIIVFPEAVLWTYGLLPPPNSSVSARDLMQAYGESLPAVGSIPCYDIFSADNHTSISMRISCMSIEYKITVVINTIDVRKCNRTADINCPPDGRYQYNTDVVFDGQNGGQIAAIYHKYHLYGTYPVLNYPLKPEVVSFHSSFGVTFGIIICFDISFLHPVQNLLKQGIQHFIFSTWWFNSGPVFTATMFQQAFSRKFQTVLLAANTGASYLNSGSGIYENGSMLKSHYNCSTFNQDTYIVANVSKEMGRSKINYHNSKSRNTYNTRLYSDHKVAFVSTGINDIESRSNNSVPCQFDSPRLIENGYCTPFLDRSFGSFSSNSSISYQVVVPNTNFSCSVEGTMVNTEGENNKNDIGQYVLFANRGLYTYHNRHVGGKNTTLLVETCAVFHCNNKKLMNGAQGTDAGVRMDKNLTCSNSFDATKLFSKIVIKGSFTEQSIQYSMIGFGDNVGLLNNASDLITTDGFMSWENKKMGNGREGKLFSALIRGILQKE